ncbi:hypothetical protein D3C72_2219160 [compost metagenome]
MHFFVFADIGGIEQILVDGAGALVVQLGMGGRYTVDLGFEHRTLHGNSPAGQSK